MTRHIFRPHCPVRTFLSGMTALLWLASSGMAAETEFEQLLIHRQINAIQVLDGHVFSGLDGGGILVSDAADLAVTNHWTAGVEIAGNDVQDFAWTGRHLWIATLGSGLTRVIDPVGNPDFRQYTSNIGGLDVTAVDGTIIGNSERVFYGTGGQGLGLITDGLSSSVYTAEQDGLISNDINDVQFLGGEVFVATPVGISRFANNVFTDQNTGLPGTEVFDLDLDAAGRLIVGGRGGVSRWDPDTESWTRIGSLADDVRRISSDDDHIYALTIQSVLYQATGTTWAVIPLPESVCTAVHAAEELWVGGKAIRATGGGKLEHAYLGRQLPAGDFITQLAYSTQVFNGMGVTIGADDSLWMGDFSGFDISRRVGGQWSHIYELPHAGNDTLTLFPGRGNVLAMTTGAEGTVWATQFAGGGVLKYDPESDRTEHIEPGNSGLNGRLVVNLVSHPDGALFVLHDATLPNGDPEMVDVLVDPDHWSDPASWITLTRDDGLGEGSVAHDALVERRDVIWFAISGVGLVRWDINGLQAGPDDPLTWFDRTDDYWSPPISDFRGTSRDPKLAKSLAVGTQGTVWAGGNGLVQFFYDAAVDTHLVWHAISEKFSATGVGLVNGNVQDIAEARGEIWVSTRSGLNRVRTSSGRADVTAWIDLRNYLDNPDFASLYSPNVIAPLPGLTYQRITASADGKHLLLASDQGITLISPVISASGGDDSTNPLSGVYCFPNPWSPGASGVKLGVAGLPTDANGIDPVRIDIYTLEGQPVRGGNHTSGESVWSFWDGRNRLGKYVASGLYVLKVSWRDWHAVRTVALVR